MQRFFSYNILILLAYASASVLLTACAQPACDDPLRCSGEATKGEGQPFTTGSGDERPFDEAGSAKAAPPEEAPDEVPEADDVAPLCLDDPTVVGCNPLGLPDKFRDIDGDRFCEEGEDTNDDGYCLQSDNELSVQNKRQDCNESRKDINPNQREICNNRDDDCDGEVDEDEVCPSDLEKRIIQGKVHLVSPPGMLVSWSQAEARCNEEGFFLMQVESVEEERALHTLITADWNAGAFWLGGSDYGHEGQWRWRNGNRIFSNGSTSHEGAYANWWPGEPNNWAGEHYLLFWRGGDSYGFNDSQGHRLHRFACERDE